MTWRVHADPVMVVAGVGGLLQALHPLAMAGVVWSIVTVLFAATAWVEDIVPTVTPFASTMSVFKVQFLLAA